MDPASILYDPQALTSLQRQRREALVGLLSRSLRGVVELPGGYTLHYAAGKSVWKLLAEWVDLERRCCSALHFALECEEDGTVHLHVTGPEGVKPFLKQHLGL